MKKDSVSDCYLHLSEMWGHVIIFEKAARTTRHYAYFMDINGLVAHTLTKGMYHYVTKDAYHIYRRNWTSAQWAEWERNMIKVSDYDIKEMYNKLTVIVRRRGFDVKELLAPIQIATYNPPGKKKCAYCECEE